MKNCCYEIKHTKVHFCLLTKVTAGHPKQHHWTAPLRISDQIHTHWVSSSIHTQQYMCRSVHR